MTKVLIVYGTRYGATASTSEEIGEILTPDSTIRGTGTLSETGQKNSPKRFAYDPCEISKLIALVMVAKSAGSGI